MHVQGSTFQLIDGDIVCVCCTSFGISGHCVFCINTIRDCFWGNVVRVYPWIVQGFTFLSAWKTQCINNYNTCCMLYKLMPLFY